MVKFTSSVCSEIGINRHHLAKRRVLAHGFELALPEIDKARGQGFQLSRIFILPTHVRIVTRSCMLVSSNMAHRAGMTRRNICLRSAAITARLNRSSIMAELAAAGECMTEENSSGGGDADLVVIKKYANRRLYNTSTSSYVTLDHLSQMVKDGTEFVVRDAKTGEDITHQVLTQIIVEEEAKGQNLLPISFLRQLIRLYDDSMHAFVPRYLELTMENFSHNQERMRSRVDEAFGGIFPVAELEEMGRQNMAAFQKTLNMFSPVGAGAAPSGNQRADQAPESPESPKPSESPAEAAEATKAKGAGDEISLLKSQLDNMQAQLDKLAHQSKHKK